MINKKWRTCPIYKHTLNGKVYIGQTWQTIKKRCETNGTGYEGCPHFWHAIQKYGWEKVETEILYYAFDQEEANEWEDYYQEFYDSCNPEKGYNIKRGGSNGKMAEETKAKISASGKGRKHSDETKEKMRQTKLGDKNPMFGKTMPNETRQKLSDALSGENHPNFGKQHSEETRRRIAKGNTGRKASEETKQKQSIAHSGENNHMYGVRLCGEDNPFYGKTHSEETRKKLSQANRMPIEKEKLILKLVFDGVSKNDISKIVGYALQTIYKVIRRNR